MHQLRLKNWPGLSEMRWALWPSTLNSCMSTSSSRTPALPWPPGGRAARLRNLGSFGLQARSRDRHGCIVSRQRENIRPKQLSPLQAVLQKRRTTARCLEQEPLWRGALAPYPTVSCKQVHGSTPTFCHAATLLLSPELWFSAGAGSNYLAVSLLL